MKKKISIKDIEEYDQIMSIRHPILNHLRSFIGPPLYHLLSPQFHAGDSMLTIRLPTSELECFGDRSRENESSSVPFTLATNSECVAGVNEEVGAGVDEGVNAGVDAAVDVGVNVGVEDGVNVGFDFFLSSSSS